METREGQKVWKDLCVFESMFGGATLPCDWIAYDRANRCVYLKGHPVGPVVGSEKHMRNEQP